MNRTVTATNMEVKVVAEDGILIANVNKSGWSNSANALVTNAAALVPTSAAKVASPVFVHASSTEADNAQPNQAVANYTDLTALSTAAATWSWSDAGTATGVGYVENGTTAGYQDADEKAYVLMNKFYIKSSGASLTGEDLLINDVVVTGADKKVENALRVLVVVDGTAFLYAPVSGAESATPTLTYKWKNTTDVTASAYNTYDVSSGVTDIPNDNDHAIEVAIYIYYEGEDANCKSTNISGITTNDLAVTVRLGLDPLHA